MYQVPPIPPGTITGLNLLTRHLYTLHRLLLEIYALITYTNDFRKLQQTWTVRRISCLKNKTLLKSLDF